MESLFNTIISTGNKSVDQRSKDMAYIKGTFFPTHEEEILRNKLVVNKEGIMERPVYPKAKMIVRTDTDQPITVQRKTYQIIENKAVIEPILEYLDKSDIKWELDHRNSFFDNNRMNLRFVYPDVKIQDDSPEGLVCGHGISNSYDGTCSVSVMDYILRLVCTNGLTRRSMRNKVWFRHTSGFCIQNYKIVLDRLMEEAPLIMNRINQLREAKVTPELLEEVEKISTKKMFEYTKKEIEYTKGSITQLNQWDLVNILTYYISHDMKQKQMADYQFAVGRLFKV